MMIATRRAILRTTALAAPAVAMAACTQNGQPVTTDTFGAMVQGWITDAQDGLNGLNDAVAAFLHDAGGIVPASAASVMSTVTGDIQKVSGWISAGEAAVVSGAKAIYTFATTDLSATSVSALLAEAATLLSGLIPLGATPNGAPSPMAVGVAKAKAAAAKLKAAA